MQALSPEQVRSARLEGYFYRHLPADHPLRAGLKPAYLAQELRHRQIKAGLLPLVRAWGEAGIEILLFKGFALAEFVYAAPGERFYGDVDVLVRPEQADSAVRMARQMGWLERWSRHDTAITHTHEISHLYTPDGQTRLDLHLEVLQQIGPQLSNRKRFTDAAWTGSTLQVWEDTTVRLLNPMDALLIGLLLSRRWGDQWGVKPHDLPDARALVEKFGLTRADLERRAHELRCSRTLELGLERCDPWTDKTALGLPPFRQRLVWELQTFGEMGSWILEHRLGRLLRSPAILAEVVRELPGVLRAVAALRRGGDMYETVRSLERAPNPHPDPSGRRVERVERGVRWSLRLLGWRKDACVPRSLAMFAALRAEGLSVSFVSGVRRVGERLEGHAWVELEGFPLPGDEQSPHLFRENFRHPPRPGK